MKPTKGYYVNLSLMTVSLLYFAVLGFLRGIIDISNANSMAVGLLIFLFFPMLLICYAVMLGKYRDFYCKKTRYLLPIAVILYCIFFVVSANYSWGMAHWIVLIVLSLALAAIPWIKLIVDKRRKRA